MYIITHNEIYGKHKGASNYDYQVIYEDSFQCLVMSGRESRVLVRGFFVLLQLNVNIICKEQLVLFSFDLVYYGVRRYEKHE